jgi:hypothetical protein
MKVYYKYVLDDEVFSSFIKKNIRDIVGEMYNKQTNTTLTDEILIKNVVDSVLDKNMKLPDKIGDVGIDEVIKQDGSSKLRAMKISQQSRDMVSLKVILSYLPLLITGRFNF